MPCFVYRVGAHPRSRGENRTDGPYGIVPRGSSPLTRGKRPPAGWSRSCPGLIPAHAGKTSTPCGTSSRRWAHPRSRGENIQRQLPVELIQGSSPLTRGKHLIEAEAQQRFGLIPAHAGKTREAGTSRMPSRAHPRSRGENLQDIFDLVSAAGSSPLTRGKPPAGHADPSRTGLIPAHAGKTRASWARSCPRRAHPRSRGENLVWHPEDWHPAGSSPLTRGKPGRPPLPTHLWGLIPAHAGKTNAPPATYTTTRAHPRSRGENHRR